MAQQLQTITLGAPGFKGLNTEDSSVNMDPAFASVANNCILDKFGRLGARKGFATLTTDRSELSDGAGGFNPIVSLHQFVDEAGNTALFGTGNSKILKATTVTTTNDTLVDVTPGAYTVNADDWKLIHFNDKMYFFQRGHQPLMYSNALGAVVTIDSESTDSSTCKQAHAALAAYGRLWLADVTGDKATVYWSDLYIGENWDTGSSGSIDITSVWPNGYDEITAIAAHNDALIIFGEENTVIYSGASSPSTMVLQDTIAGVGCVSRDSVEPTGGDLLFLSSTGLRSLGRTIQENARPMTDVSNNVRRDIITDLIAERAAIVANTGNIVACYSPEEAFYLVSFQSLAKTYCFDMRGTLEDGSFRVTLWPSTPFTSCVRAKDGTLYLGSAVGLGTYAGYQDNGESYRYQFYSPVLTFGDNARQKILKKVRPIIVGGSGQDAVLYWGYGYSGTFSAQTFALDTGGGSEFGVGEFGIAEFSGGITITDKGINATGSGPDVTIGLETNVDGSAFSLQEITVQTLIGRII